MKRRFAVLAFVAAVASVTAAAPSAQALEFEVGGMVGGNWNLLVQPTDEQGSHTFLWGSAFSGYGMVAGPTASTDVFEFEGATLSITADLLYGYHRGQGFAAHSEGGQIDVLFTSHALRVPLLVRVGNTSDKSTLTLGVGVEPILGMMSTATVTTTDVDADFAPVNTTPASTVAGVLALGYDWVGRDLVVPLDARLVFNPFQPSSTEERFEGFSSPDDPGEFRVGFDWQFFVTAGVRWELSR